MIKTDIDIDLPTSFNPVNTFENCVRASIIKDETLQPHPCGTYFQNIPKDPSTGFSAIPYDIAEELDFVKIDFLHLNLLDSFGSRQEIEDLLEIEPDWTLLTMPSVVNKLFQVGKHGKMLIDLAPKSIEELADAIAMTKPAKRFLLDLYKRDRDAARKELYKIEKESYGYKKAHALAYALNIVLQLHLISAGLL